LRRQDVLDFASADAESECAKCAVRARMTVSTNNRHPRLRQSQLRANYVDDALLFRVDIEESSRQIVPQFARSASICFARNRIGDGQRTIGGRHVVIDRCDSQIRRGEDAPGVRKPSNACGEVTS
jgi:hypothetical protein